MVEFLCVRRWEKRNKTDFYRGVVKVCVRSIGHGGIETFCFLRYWNILSPTFIKILNYIKSLCIVFMLNQFKYFDQKNQEIFIQKCFNTLRPRYVSGSKMFQYLHVVYYFLCCKTFKMTEIKIQNGCWQRPDTKCVNEKELKI